MDIESKFFEGQKREFMKKHFAGFAFISFETEHGKNYYKCLEKERVLKDYRTSRYFKK